MSHSKTGKSTQEVIYTNKKHPSLTVEKGFLPVGQMRLGIHVMDAAGQVGVITEWKIVPRMKTMYNLEEENMARKRDLMAKSEILCDVGNIAL